MADRAETAPDALVRVEGLAKRYDRQLVIENVSLRLGRGDLVGLVGANGGGKTTTLRMLAGLIRPDAGSGTVLGEPVSAPPRARKRLIGYMGQRLALYPDLSALENLHFYADVRGLARGAVDAVIARYGIGPVLARRFGQLSGGWARRVQFAATLLHAPPLLLLDEPTAGLDVATRADIWRWLGELAGAGHAIVISTHDLAEAERCPSVVLYHEGRARAQASPLAIAAEAGEPTLERAVLAFAGVAR